MVCGLRGIKSSPGPSFYKGGGEWQRRGVYGFPPLKKGGLRGDSYGKSSPGPSFYKGGVNGKGAVLVTSPL